MDNSNTSALVTGASRGLGAASARALAGEGASLFLTARDEELLVDLAAELGAAGANVAFKVADLTDPAAAEQVAAAARARFRRLDVLVNCAGSSQGGLFWEIPDQVWEDSLNAWFGFDFPYFASIGNPFCQSALIRHWNLPIARFAAGSFGVCFSVSKLSLTFANAADISSIRVLISRAILTRLVSRDFVAASNPAFTSCLAMS